MYFSDRHDHQNHCVEALIVGDFNIHVDSSNNESKGFLDILNANGLTQHVTSPTHQKAHARLSDYKGTE